MTFISRITLSHLVFQECRVCAAWPMLAKISSVQLSSVMSDSLQPHGPQHARPPCPGGGQLPELAQTHVCCVGDAIEPTHPLPSPSPSAFNLSQHQGLFQ